MCSSAAQQSYWRYSSTFVDLKRWFLLARLSARPISSSKFYPLQLASTLKSPLRASSTLLRLLRRHSSSWIWQTSHVEMFILHFNKSYFPFSATVERAGWMISGKKCSRFYSPVPTVQLAISCLHLSSFFTCVPVISATNAFTNALYDLEKPALLDHSPLSASASWLIDIISIFCWWTTWLHQLNCH